MSAKLLILPKSIEMVEFRTFSKLILRNFAAKTGLGTNTGN